MTLGSVLVVTPRWTRDGGVAAHAQASAAALAAHGLRVHALAAQVLDGPEGVPATTAPRLFDATARMAERLAGAAELHPDVIHVHQVDDPEIVTALRELAPVVSSAHGYVACTSGVHYFAPGEECGRAHGPGCVGNLALRGCAHTRHVKKLPHRYRAASGARAALQIADVAVCYSATIERHLEVNGVARRAVVPLFPTMPAREGSGHADRRRVVFAGRLVRPKGVDVLIRAAAAVDGEFVLCGEGRKLEPMRRLARAQGVQDRVRFAGWLDSGALAQELAVAVAGAVRAGGHRGPGGGAPGGGLGHGRRGRVAERRRERAARAGGRRAAAGGGAQRAAG
jgi:glycosyltransferase involved in cell wall biosynthesis